VLFSQAAIAKHRAPTANSAMGLLIAKGSVQTIPRALICQLVSERCKGTVPSADRNAPYYLCPTVTALACRH
jgi:hypothetical protein